MFRKRMGDMVWYVLAAVLLMLLVAGCSSGGSGEDSPDPAGNEGMPSPSDASETDNEPSSGEEQVELRFAWWGSQDRHDRTLKVIELYEQENPNIKITPEFAGWDGYWEKLATQAAGGNLPDIVQMEKGYLAEYTNRNLMENLDPYVESGLLDLSDVDEVYLSDGRLNGNLYALNIGANALATAVDTEMYEQAGVPLPKPGQTWQEFMDEARKLKAALGDEVYVDAHISRDGFEFYLRGHGQTLYNEEGTALGFEQKYLLDFFTMMKTLTEEGVLPPPEVVASIQGLEDELIVHGKSPNIAFWSNQIVAISEAADRSFKMVMVPIVEGEGNNKSYIVKASQYLSVSTQSEYPEESIKFINFFTNSIEANEIMDAERGIPISSKIRDHLYPNLSPASKEMFDFIETAAEFAGPWSLGPPGEGAVSSAFLRNFESIIYGQNTTEEATVKFMEEANEILGK